MKKKKQEEEEEEEEKKEEEKEEEEKKNEKKMMKKLKFTVFSRGFGPVRFLHLCFQHFKAPVPKMVSKKARNFGSRSLNETL